MSKPKYGYYILMTHAGDSELVAAFERNLRLWDQVFKYMTLKLDSKEALAIEELKGKEVEITKNPPPLPEEHRDRGPRRGPPRFGGGGGDGDRGGYRGGGGGYRDARDDRDPRDTRDDRAPEGESGEHSGEKVEVSETPANSDSTSGGAVS